MSDLRLKGGRVDFSRWLFLHLGAYEISRYYKEGLPDQRSHCHSFV